MPNTPVVHDPDSNVYFRENEGRFLAGGFEPEAKVYEYMYTYMIWINIKPENTFSLNTKISSLDFSFSLSFWMVHYQDRFQKVSCQLTGTISIIFWKAFFIEFLVCKMLF